MVGFGSPNGGKDCHYRHALPPGYVLKSQMKALIEEETEKIPIEEEIQNQCAKLTSSTPMTPELFLQWKEKKMEQRDACLAAERAERAKNDHMMAVNSFCLILPCLWMVMRPMMSTKVMKNNMLLNIRFQLIRLIKALLKMEPSTSTSTAGDAEALDDEDDDDDEMDMDEIK